MSQSLYDRLGGAAALEAAVELFYLKLLADPRISAFYDKTDLPAQRAKQKAFLSMVFGGPVQFKSRDLRTASAPLIAQGFKDRHFDAVAEHLQTTLEELGIAPELTAEVMTIASDARDDVLNR